MYWLGKAAARASAGGRSEQPQRPQPGVHDRHQHAQGCGLQVRSTRGPGRPGRQAPSPGDPARTRRRPPRGQAAPTGGATSTTGPQREAAAGAGRGGAPAAVAAYHLAGDVATPRPASRPSSSSSRNSPLLPLVLFRSAENSYVKAEQLAKQNNAGGGEAAFAEAAAKYEEVSHEVPRVRARQPCPLRPRTLLHRRRRTGRRPPRCSKRSRPRSAIGDLRRCRTSWPIASSAPPRRRPRTPWQDNMLREKLGHRRQPPRRASSPPTRRPRRRPTRS